MSVVISVPGQAVPWKVNNAAFRLLTAEVQDLTPDAEFMLQAAAMNGLHLDLEPPSERGRLAVLLAEAARNLRYKLLSRPLQDEFEQGLVDYLPVLEMWMEGLATDAS